VVRDAPAVLMETLDAIPYGRDQFYAVRAQEPAALGGVERAARFIYLNKTGFNGLYRVNRAGRFNVPFGRHARPPRLYDRDNLVAVSAALADVAIECAPFETVLPRARAGDFVYCDPPYHPLSPTARFTSYTEGAFSIADQRRLAAAARDLTRRGCAVVVSNSDTPEVRALYEGFAIDRVLVSRPINSRADRRGAIGELLIVGDAAAAPPRRKRRAMVGTVGRDA
jgi:DNA adenine methylase